MNATKTRVRKQVVRTLNFIPNIFPLDGTAALIIRTGKLLVGYWLTAIPSAIGGRAFELVKGERRGGETYHLRILSDGRAECDCKGHVHHGHCKHGDALLKLLELGELPDLRSADQIVDSKIAA